MVIAAGGKKNHAVADALRLLKPQNVTIERQRAFEVRDPQVYVPDANRGMDRKWLDRDRTCFPGSHNSPASLRELDRHLAHPTLRRWKTQCLARKVKSTG
jgi:predicted NACHT family NTPase